MNEQIIRSNNFNLRKLLILPGSCFDCYSCSYCGFCLFFFKIQAETSGVNVFTFSADQSNWETLTNENIDCSIKYSQGWSTKKCGSADPGYKSWALIELDKCLEDEQSANTACQVGNAARTITIYRNNFYQEETGDPLQGNFKDTQLFIDGKIGLRIKKENFVQYIFEDWADRALI